MEAIVAHISISSSSSSDARNDEQTYVHAALIKQIIASRSALSRTWYDRWMLRPLCHLLVRFFHLGTVHMTFILSKFYEILFKMFQPLSVCCNRGGTSTTQTHDRLEAFKCNHQLSPSRCKSVWKKFGWELNCKHTKFWYALQKLLSKNIQWKFPSSYAVFALPTEQYYYVV